MKIRRTHHLPNLPNQWHSLRSAGLSNLQGKFLLLDLLLHCSVKGVQLAQGEVGPHDVGRLVLLGMCSLACGQNLLHMENCSRMRLLANLANLAKIAMPS